jgi:hypothetical protein
MSRFFRSREASYATPPNHFLWAQLDTLLQQRLAGADWTTQVRLAASQRAVAAREGCIPELIATILGLKSARGLHSTIKRLDAGSRPFTDLDLFARLSARLHVTRAWKSFHTVKTVDVAVIEAVVGLPKPFLTPEFVACFFGASTERVQVLLMLTNAIHAIAPGDRPEWMAGPDWIADLAAPDAGELADDAAETARIERARASLARCRAFLAGAGGLSDEQAAGLAAIDAEITGREDRARARAEQAERRKLQQETERRRAERRAERDRQHQLHQSRLLAMQPLWADLDVLLAERLADPDLSPARREAVEAVGVLVRARQGRIHRHVGTLIDLEHTPGLRSAIRKMNLSARLPVKAGFLGRLALRLAGPRGNMILGYVETIDAGVIEALEVLPDTLCQPRVLNGLVGATAFQIAVLRAVLASLPALSPQRRQSALAGGRWFRDPARLLECAAKLEAEGLLADSAVAAELAAARLAKAEAERLREAEIARQRAERLQREQTAERLQREQTTAPAPPARTRVEGLGHHLDELPALFLAALESRRGPVTGHRIVAICDPASARWAGAHMSNCMGNTFQPFHPRVRPVIWLVYDHPQYPLAIELQVTDGRLRFGHALGRGNANAHPGVLYEVMAWLQAHGVDVPAEAMHNAPRHGPLEDYRRAPLAGRHGARNQDAGWHDVRGVTELLGILAWRLQQLPHDLRRDNRGHRISTVRRRTAHIRDRLRSAQANLVAIRDAAVWPGLVPLCGAPECEGHLPHPPENADEVIQRTGAALRALRTADDRLAELTPRVDLATRRRERLSDDVVYGLEALLPMVDGARAFLGPLIDQTPPRRDASRGG